MSDLKPIYNYDLEECNRLNVELTNNYKAPQNISMSHFRNSRFWQPLP